jgi:anti-sigma-K factor RskA
LERQAFKLKGNEMDSNGKFWVSLWSAAFVFIAVLAALAVSYNHNRLELLAKSPNPVALACANQSASQSVCQMYFNSIKGQ